MYSNYIFFVVVKVTILRGTARGVTHIHIVRQPSPSSVPRTASLSQADALPPWKLAPPVPPQALAPTTYFLSFWI